jgi:hypothetical protein
VRNLNRPFKAALGFSDVGIVLLQQQLAPEPINLRLIDMFFMFIRGSACFR